MKTKFVLISILTIVLTSCGTSTPDPTLTPTSKPLPTATQTPTPEPTATETPLPPTPTDIPTEEPGFELSLPVGEPDSEWQGVPIMPGAIAGEGDSSYYKFTIEMGENEIWAYYDEEMGKLGWSALAQGTNDAGDRVMTFYQKGVEMMTFSVVSDTGVEGVVLVLIV